MRIGYGWDLHRLAPGRPFRLGGLTLPHPRGPQGHSDGDVLLHALMDALLGAAGLGDIGLLFPDTDPRYEGADSALLLEEVLRRIHRVGYRVGNADITVVLERPKIGPYRDTLRQRIAQLLEVHPSHINVKAKTAEGLGDIGKGEAVACHAVVLLEEESREG